MTPEEAEGPTQTERAATLRRNLDWLASWDRTDLTDGKRQVTQRRTLDLDRPPAQGRSKP